MTRHRDKLRLTIPFFRPVAQDDHSANMRAIERWANNLLPVVVQGGPESIMLQSGSDVTNPLSGAGEGTVPFPTPFPESCTTVVVSNGDGNAVPGSDPQVLTKSTTGFTYRTNPNAGAVAYRVNWVATGT